MALTYLSLSLIGIFPNILLGIALTKTHGKLVEASFFILTIQILICDMGELLTQIIVAFPLSLYGSNIYKGEVTIWIYNITNVVDTISYNGVLIFTFVVAINRITVFLWPKLHDFFFGPLHIWRTVAAVWCLILFEVCGANALQCWKQYSYKGFYFYIKCYNLSSGFSLIWFERRPDYAVSKLCSSRNNVCLIHMLICVLAMEIAQHFQKLSYDVYAKEGKHKFANTGRHHHSVLGAPNVIVYVPSQGWHRIRQILLKPCSKRNQYPQQFHQSLRVFHHQQANSPRND
ncbi:hypothetical protein OESDEN_10158 [Oesophagostomum dentatum]|uniref:7TM GPCR serpentine receptor class x (Srx) domain-containing protein n=1 Tax=Oesophagostomum dentatum TaxID=61180 RepID=A0A0B1SYE6_OESDE|nr:hypothetical protein OESDEN_10158 [Oesophagostomum dentatum]